MSAQLLQTARPLRPAHLARAGRQLTTCSAAPMRILGVSGSIRKGSNNTKLLEAAKKVLSEGVTLEIAQIDDLPLLNTDLEERVEGGARFPAPVERLRKQVRDADAILFGNPEYNYSVSAPLKNAIDWASRPMPKNERGGKPAAILSVAGGFSGILGQSALRQSGPFFDEETGELLDDTVRQRLKAVVEALVAWTHQLQK